MNLKEVHGKGINGSGFKIAIIDIPQDEGIQLDHKAFEKPHNCTIQAMRVSSSNSKSCHALTCTAVAVGEPYDNVFLKCDKGVKCLR